MAIINFATGKDISIEVNGKKIATAQGYKVKTTKESRYVEAFGSTEPIGTIGGRIKHTLVLSRVVLNQAAFTDGIDFHSLSGFNVVIVKPDCKLIYSGCEWSQISQAATLDDVVLEEVTIVATKRLVTA
ncbi:MAG: hypothetical protein RR263_03565 [Oscillospiraceae bacterium]